MKPASGTAAAHAASSSRPSITGARATTAAVPTRGVCSTPPDGDGICAPTPPANATQPAPPDAYWALVRDGNDGAVVGAGLRNTSKLILSRESVPGAMALLAADAMQPQVDSVIGPRRSLNAFAAASGRAWRSGHQHRIYECRAVVPPASTAGSRRIAGPEDRELLVDWTQAFRSEALGEVLTRDEAAGIADRHLGSGGMHVWTVDGEVVTCAAAVGPTPRGIRIGGVYTPPEHRRHGRS